MKKYERNTNTIVNAMPAITESTIPAIAIPFPVGFVTPIIPVISAVRRRIGEIMLTNGIHAIIKPMIPVINDVTAAPLLCRCGGNTATETTGCC